MRPLFEHIPFPLTFKIYIFNLTNPEDFSNGGKPKVQEIGPYVFEWVCTRDENNGREFLIYVQFSEWKLRENLEDNDFDDTLSYTHKQQFIFHPELSNGLTGEEEVYVPNLIMFGTLMTVKREREAFLPTVIKAMRYIYGNETSPFMKVKVMDVLFRGIPLNCSGRHFEVKVCNSRIFMNECLMDMREFKEFFGIILYWNLQMIHS